MNSVETRFSEQYLALSSRDSRFDGQFIAGVHSTGIYCRPSCPAMTPRRENVRFYRTAAAAHEAGLRACKRCQPDAVPGSPDWNIRDDLASRAMRLIADGVVEREGVPGLARRLGYTSRHLGRVLTAELGAGPLALARAQRAASARALLIGTDLPMSDVAFAAGFSSIRQFNDTIAEVYTLTPTELRARRRSHPVAPAGSSTDDQTGATPVTLRLPARAPFDGAGLMHFFADHAVPGLEDASAVSFERAVRLPRSVGRLRLMLADDAGVVCTAWLSDLGDLGAVVSRVRRMFDLDADSVAIDGALGRDDTLAPLIAATPGIRLPGSIDTEEMLFRTLIGQQISVAAARTVLGRLVEQLGTDGLFPTAAQLAGGGSVVLRGPAARVRTILAVAERIAAGDLVLDVSRPAEDFIADLQSQPGIGPWTAGYLAMRVLGNPDVMLGSDLVLRQSAALRGLPTTAAGLAAHAAQWAPWRSYAALHLWRARHWLPSRNDEPTLASTRDA